MLPEQVRVTVVLNTRPGELLADLLPFLGLGSTVTIGRAGAIVASVHEGDQVEQVHLLEHQLILAETASSAACAPVVGCVLTTGSPQ